MLKLALLLLLILLPACAQQPARIDAGGGVDIVWHRTSEVHRICEGLSGRKEFFQILGCSKWTPPGEPGRRTCAIYAPEPRDERDTQRFATLGHELMHCFDGNWHDRWGAMIRQPGPSAAAGGSARQPAGSTANSQSQ